MLVLTRKAKPREDKPEVKDESGIRFVNNSSEPVILTIPPGESLGSIHIVKLAGTSVRVGIDLPRSIAVVRAELPLKNTPVLEPAAAE